MNRHLLHPALIHRFLQRMTWNLHLDAMRGNRLDILLVLPCHQWENLGAKTEGDSRNQRWWWRQWSKWECIPFKNVLVEFLPVPPHPLWPQGLWGWPCWWPYWWSGSQTEDTQPEHSRLCPAFLSASRSQFQHSPKNGWREEHSQTHS